MLIRLWIQPHPGKHQTSWNMDIDPLKQCSLIGFDLSPYFFWVNIWFSNYPKSPFNKFPQNDSPKIYGVKHGKTPLRLPQGTSFPMSPTQPWPGEPGASCVALPRCCKIVLALLEFSKRTGAFVSWRQVDPLSKTWYTNGVIKHAWDNSRIFHWLVVKKTSWTIWVNGKDDIPYMKWKIKFTSTQVASNRLRDHFRTQKLFLKWNLQGGS